MICSLSSLEKRCCSSVTPTLFQQSQDNSNRFETIFAVKPKFEVQVHDDNPIQMNQEAVVKRCHEEQVKVVFPKTWQVELYT